MLRVVTGKFANKPTCGHSCHRLVNLRTKQLARQTICELVMLWKFLVENLE